MRLAEAQRAPARHVPAEDRRRVGRPCRPDCPDHHPGKRQAAGPEPRRGGDDGRSPPLVCRRSRTGLRPGRAATDRRQAAPGDPLADRCDRSDRALELPAGAGDPQGRPRPGHGKRRPPQARHADAAHRHGPRGAVSGSRNPPRHPAGPARPQQRHRRRPRRPPPRPQDRPDRLDRYRQADHGPGRRGHQARQPRTRRQEPEHHLRRRRRRRRRGRGAPGRVRQYRPGPSPATTSPRPSSTAWARAPAPAKRKSSGRWRA